MPEPIRLEPWHRMSRGIPTYETIVHQAIGPEWEDLTRIVQLALDKAKKRWVLAVFDGTRRVREWSLPYYADSENAQKAAERWLMSWGIRDVDPDLDVGQEKKPSLEQANGFAWARLKKTVVAMFQDPQTRADGVLVLNRVYPGRGTELGEAMVVIERAAQNDLSALMEVKAIADAVKNGALILRPDLEKYRTVNEARKEAEAAQAAFQAEQIAEWRKKRGLQPEGRTFQAEVTRQALESSDTSPYERLTA